jgi:VIT1/CCC1 family predicted Fe2+/Mn2+ transporter
MVYGALDGVVTTLAVISGTTGASLEPRIGLILGVANLMADGLSMGASNYLGLRSELEQTGKSVADEKPWRHGLATLIAFAIVGAAPLLAFAPLRPWGATTFQTAVLFGVVALAVVGGIRARYVGKAIWRSAAEVIVIGTLTSGTAFAIGSFVERLTR